MENENLELMDDEGSVEDAMNPADEVSDEFVTEDAVIEIDDQPEPAEDNVPGSARFEGNGIDIAALIALISGAFVFISCATGGLGFFVMPLVAIVLGLVGVFTAKNAVKPARTQLLSWLGIGTGVIVILLGLLGFAVYAILILGFVKGSGY